MEEEKHVFKRILHSPTSTNHSLNARSPVGNDERSFCSPRQNRRSVTFGQFFESTSFSARLSSVRSATTCFSFRFSSSSCFSFLASPLSIPPYFGFQR